MGDMTEPAVPPGAYPGYATPTFVAHDVCWIVTAHPWGERVGWVESHSPEGWTAINARSHYVGLYPDQQAAGEALVKRAGYELLGD